MTSPQHEGPSAGPSMSEGTAALVVQDIVVGYGGGDVLRGVSLQVHQGGITCVVGPNGAGQVHPPGRHQRAAPPPARPDQPAR